MAQVTIYLDDETEAKMRASAKAMGIPQSKWIANLIKKKVTDKWPESVRQLAGAWRDLPTAEEIRRSSGRDAARENL